MKEMTGILVETQLVSSPRYSHTHNISCPQVSHEKQNSSGPTATVKPCSHNWERVWTDADLNLYRKYGNDAKATKLNFNKFEQEMLGKIKFYWNHSMNAGGDHFGRNKIL